MATTVRNNCKVTTKEYAELMGITPATARRHLEKMVVEGKATAAYNCQQAIPRKRYSGRTPPYTYVTVYTLLDQAQPVDSKDHQ